MKDKPYREMIRDKMKEVRAQMDDVNHPPHYNASKIETIDMIESATEHGFEYYLQGNIIKYITTHHQKGGKDDVKKVIHYCNLLIELHYPDKKRSLLKEEGTIVADIA